MDIYHVIERPLVTEKSTHQTTQTQAQSRSRDGRGGSYTFEVHPEATKAEIRQAVEKVYSVKVIGVRTSNRIGKTRRYKQTLGKTRGWKKAVVVLDPNHHIDLF